MNWENEFMKEHLLTVNDVTENIIEKMKKDEGIIITTENGKVIDIDAVWDLDNQGADCWNVRVYESYEQYVKCGYVFLWDSVFMDDFTINHIWKYMMC